MKKNSMYKTMFAVAGIISIMACKQTTGGGSSTNGNLYIEGGG